jgi:hypothetical protein
LPSKRDWVAADLISARHRNPEQIASMDEQHLAPFPRGKRLKGLEEFETPGFVGRMARVERRKRLGWWAMVAAAFALGGAIGWWLI